MGSVLVKPEAASGSIGMLCTATGDRHGHAQPGLPAVDRPPDWGHQRHGEANVGERRRSGLKAEVAQLNAMLERKP
jgi:hypothetical protein